MTAHIDVVDAGHRPPGPEWDRFVRGVDLPPLWDGAAIQAYARASAEVVLLARAELGGRTAAVSCYRGWRRGLPHRRYRNLDRAPRPLVLRAVPPVSFHPGVVFHPDLEGADRDHVVGALEAAVRRWCGRVPMLFVYEFLGEGDGVVRRGRRLRQTPNAVIDVSWTDLDGYLAQLPVRHRRRLRHVAHGERGRPATDALGGVRLDPLEMQRLEFMTRLRHLPTGRGATPLPSGYLPALLRTDRAMCFGRVRAGSLVQFDLAMTHRRRLTLTATGMHDRASHDELYADALLDAVTWAGGNGIERIDLGPGTLHEKLRFGARLLPQHATAAVPWP